MAEARRRPLTAADKLTFLITLVPYLIEQVRVSVEEAAAHFDTTPEAIRRAVTLIATSGVPDEQGAVLPGAGMFDIDWDDFEDNDRIKFRQAPLQDQPRLSGREAAALLAGLQTIASLPDFSGRSDIAALMEKLARGSVVAPAAVAVAATEADEALLTVRRAQAQRQRLRLEYTTTRGVTEEREVDPIRLDTVDGVAYLRAWCLTRDAERTFRLDRMRSVVAVGRADDHADSSSDPAQLIDDLAGQLRVIVRLPQEAVPLIADYLSPTAEFTESEGNVDVPIALAHEGMIGRLAARIAGVGSIVEPDSAVAATAEWARAAIRAQSGD